jgi:hypothetical protein
MCVRLIFLMRSPFTVDVYREYCAPRVCVKFSNSNDLLNNSIYNNIYHGCSESLNNFTNVFIVSQYVNNNVNDCNDLLLCIDSYPVVHVDVEHLKEVHFCSKGMQFLLQNVTCTLRMHRVLIDRADAVSLKYNY